MVEDAFLDLLSSLRLDAENLLYVAVIIVAALLAVRALHFIMQALASRYAAHGNKIRMLFPLLKLLIYAALVFVVVTTLFELGSAEVLLASGLFGAALGLGLKDVFADMVTGIVMVFEKPYHIGDMVSVEGHYGEVKDMGFRATRILTPDDDLVSVPNILMFNRPVASANYGSPHMMVTVDIYTDFGCDRKEVMRVLREAAVTSRYSNIRPGYPVLVLVKDSPFYVRFRVRSYVWNLADEFAYETDLTVRAWRELARMGVEPPRMGWAHGLEGNA